MKAAEFGINGGWGGIRTTSALLTNLMQIQQIPWTFYKDANQRSKRLENSQTDMLFKNLEM
jgi:hypothetical protein